LFVAMTLFQVRWWGMCYGLLFALLAAQAAIAERAPAGRGRALLWRSLFAAAFLPGIISTVRATWMAPGVTRDDVHVLTERDVAQWLRLRMGRERAVVLSAPSSTTPLIYYGGLEGVGSLYWENREGLEHAAAIFAARSPDEAQALIRRYGVTHIVLFSWNPFAEDYVRLFLGWPPAQPLPREVFVSGLLHGGEVPPWLRLIPYRLPRHQDLDDQGVLIFEVTPAQRPKQAAARVAEYLAEMGRVQAAAGMESVLDGGAPDLTALIALAYIQGKAGEAERFAATAERIIAALPPAGEREAEDRIRLVAVLAASGRAEMARGELRRCMEQLDERSLRRLTPEMLNSLLMASRELGVEIPGPSLRRLAAELLPPSMRPKG
jgi:hypothetical protein